MDTKIVTPSMKLPYKQEDPETAMTLVILGFDGPDGQARRKIHRAAHLAGLEPLHRAGKVVLAGPFTDQAGSLIIIEADSLEDAKRIAQEDPYTIHGIFERVEVHPFLQVLPTSQPPT